MNPRLNETKMNIKLESINQPIWKDEAEKTEFKSKIELKTEFIIDPNRFHSNLFDLVFLSPSLSGYRASKIGCR